MQKLLSGRFILTIIGGLVFAYCAVMKTIEPQAIAAILTMVFVSYFQKRSEPK